MLEILNTVENSPIFYDSEALKEHLKNLTFEKFQMHDFPFLQDLIEIILKDKILFRY
jgi:hypothetical protein